MAKILIIGCGAIGMGLAKALAGQGHEVTGLKRYPPSTGDDGVNFIAADISSASDMDNLDLEVDVVFFIVSADGRTEQSYRVVYELGLQHVSAKFTRQPWFFVSSTSVYGQSQGEWVDEDALAQPDTVTSQLIRQAELRVMASGPKNVVVRFSGIYGPGREHLLRMARQAPAIQKAPPYYTNRIHQQDCVGVLLFLLQQRLSGAALQQCYLASDDDPAPLWEVIAWLARQLHCDPPRAQPFEHAAPCNKRCVNSRLKALGYQFQYAGYRDGYRELIGHE
ncbi:MAG: SDR family oxidoreductase [Methylovulum sp.]|nr:SDR family oxidoreductase [Methylovulum sp.]